jgi:hypothetical protein
MGLSGFEDMVEKIAVGCSAVGNVAENCGD